MHRSDRRDFWFVLAASIAWGTVGVANQSIYMHSATNAQSLAFLRLGIATPLFLLVCLKMIGLRRFAQIRGRDFGLMLLMGGMQALYQAAYSAAIVYSGVTISTLIALCAAPVLVALFSTLLAHERLPMRTLLALLIALSGTVLLVSARAHPVQEQVSWLGIVFSLLAATGYAAFILCGRRLASTYHPLHINTMAFGVGALLLFAFAASTHLTLAYAPEDWLILLYLGCIPTAFAYALFQIGVRTQSALVVSIVTLCEPLVAALLAWIWFHEELGLLGLLGAACLLGAMMLLAWKH